MMVARAAPAMPIPKPMTNSASSPVLMTAPEREQIMVILGLPSARIRCPPPVVSTRKGNPSAVMRT